MWSFLLVVQLEVHSVVDLVVLQRDVVLEDGVPLLQDYLVPTGARLSGDQFLKMFWTKVTSPHFQNGRSKMVVALKKFSPTSRILEQAINSPWAQAYLQTYETFQKQLIDQLFSEERSRGQTEQKLCLVGFVMCHLKAPDKNVSHANSPTVSKIPNLII